MEVPAGALPWPPAHPLPGPGGGAHCPLCGQGAEAWLGSAGLLEGTSVLPALPVLRAKWLFYCVALGGDLAGGSWLSPRMRGAGLWDRPPEPCLELPRWERRAHTLPRGGAGPRPVHLLGSLQRGCPVPRPRGCARPGIELLAACPRRSPSTLPPRLFSPPQLINLN